MLCVCTKRVCVRYTELVCIAVRLAFSCQTSVISLPFIPIPWVGSFCLRMFIYPSSSTFVAFALLIFPNSAEGIKDHALASNPKWPGLLLSDGKIPLLPNSTSLKLKWGSPILPLFIPGAPWDVIPTVPPTADILFKFSSILRKAVLPETKRLGDSLQVRLEVLDKEGVQEP